MRLVGEVAGGLKALGVEKGDRVAMVIGNSVEFVVVMFAIARLGAVSVPLNIRHQAGGEPAHHRGLRSDGRRPRA